MEDVSKYYTQNIQVEMNKLIARGYFKEEQQNGAITWKYCKDTTKDENKH